MCHAIGNEGTSSNDIDSDIMNSLTAQSTSDSVLFSNEQNDNWIRKLAKKKKSRQLDSCIQQVRDSSHNGFIFFKCAMKLMRKHGSLEITAFQITGVVDLDFVPSGSPELCSGLPGLRLFGTS